MDWVSDFWESFVAPGACLSAWRPPLPFFLALGQSALSSGLDVVGLAVLAVELHRGAVGALADVGRVLKEALLAALQGDDDLGDRRVGDGFEGGAEAAVDGVDAAGERRSRSAG